MKVFTVEFADGECIPVEANSAEEARILAQAARIRNGKTFKDAIVHW